MMIEAYMQTDIFKKQNSQKGGHSNPMNPINHIQLQTGIDIPLICHVIIHISTYIVPNVMYFPLLQ